MKRKIYDITQSDKNWKSTVRGNEKASLVAPTKEKAIKKTIEIAKKNSNSQIIIRKSDGTIQTERTYGNDPKKSKG